MEDETFTADELEFFIRMCEAAKVNGLNWPLAVANFPAETDEEKRWKHRNMRGIPHYKARGDKNRCRRPHGLSRDKPQQETEV